MRRLVPLLLVLFAACATPVVVHFGPHQLGAPVTLVNNPSLDDGDPIAGRTAFLSVRCNDCHRVAEDPSLPRGARAIAGPLLENLARATPHQLADRIRNRKTGAGEMLYDREMKDYAETMTPRQFVDIIAYLRNPKVPSRG
jgi:mono/diheme cytochrome c family protein